MQDSLPGNSLTYDILLKETENLLRSLMSFQTSAEPDRFEKAQLGGIILHWYTVSYLIDKSYEGRKDDHLRLMMLAGVTETLDEV